MTDILSLKDLMIASESAAPSTLQTLAMRLDWDSVQKRAMRLESVALSGDLNTLHTYCSVTGRPIGTMSDFDSNFLAQAIHEFDSLSDEELLDDLTTRCLAACRPGPAWIAMTPAMLERIAFVDPAGTAVYLLFRAFDSEVASHRALDLRGARTRKWDGLESQTYIMRKKIELFKALQGLRLDLLRDLLLALLQADARVGLQRLAPPTLLVEAPTSSQLAFMVAEFANPLKHAALCATLIRCYQEQLDSYYQETLKLESRARLEANARMRGAYESFKAEHAPKSKTGTVAEVKRSKKLRQQDDLMEALGDVDFTTLETPEVRAAKTLKPAFTSAAGLTFTIGIKS